MSSKKETLIAFSIFILITGFATLMGWSLVREHRSTDAKAELDKELAKVKADLATTKNNSAPQPAPQSAAAAPSSATNPLQQQMDPAEETPAPSETEEAKMEEYKSDKLKISLSYPEGFTVKENSKEISAEKNTKKITFKLYDMKESDFQKWFLAHYGKKDNPDCEFIESGIKVGTYETKQTKLKLEGTKCEDAGHFGLNSEKTKVVRVTMSSESDEEIKKIMDSFKYL